MGNSGNQAFVITGRENKTGTAYTPEDEHSCFTYTFQGRSQRNNCQNQKWFPTLQGGTVNSYTLE